MGDSLAQADEPVAARARSQEDARPGRSRSRSRRPGRRTARRTSAELPGACLRTFVSPSWTIRYVASSTPAGNPTGNGVHLEVDRDTGPAELLGERGDVGDPLPRRDRTVWELLRRAPQQRAELLERPPPGRLDRCRRSGGAGRIRRRELLPDRGLHDHHAEGARERVVELSRDRSALLLHGVRRLAAGAQPLVLLRHARRLRPRERTGVRRAGHPRPEHDERSTAARRRPRCSHATSGRRRRSPTLPPASAANAARTHGAPPRSRRGRSRRSRRPGSR